MKRETIEIADLIKEYEEWYKKQYDEEFDSNFTLDCLTDDYNIIEIIEELDECEDLDHRCFKHTVVFKRILDGKFFKTEWLTYGWDENYLNEAVAVEVFPETITKVIYK